MLEHDDELVAADAVERHVVVAQLGKAFLAVVLHARNDDVGGVAPDALVAVAQQMPPQVAIDGIHVAQLLSDSIGVVLIHIHGVVVVAQHGDDAVRGFQRGEHVLMVINFADDAVLQVASEDDEVGMEGVDAVDSTLQEGVVDRADVGIAELHNAIAVEGGRQVGAQECLAPDDELPGADVAPFGPAYAPEEAYEGDDQAQPASTTAHAPAHEEQEQGEKQHQGVEQLQVVEDETYNHRLAARNLRRAEGSSCRRRA